MKKNVIILLLLMVFAGGFVRAQTKIGYVDSDAIMDQLQDAQDARQQLDALIQEWQNELTKMERDWKTKFDEYDRKKLLLTETQKAENEAELVKMEQKITEYREKKFGTNGELFTKQDEVMKPVQNKVFNAVQKVAKAEDIDFVFDRSGGVLMLYAKEKYDITNLVLKELKVDTPAGKTGTVPPSDPRNNPNSGNDPKTK